MTRVIVNGASCLIDPHKRGLLGVLCDLPHRLVVPLPVRTYEVLDFSEANLSSKICAQMAHESCLSGNRSAPDLCGLGLATTNWRRHHLECCPRICSQSACRI